MQIGTGIGVSSTRLLGIASAVTGVVLSDFTDSLHLDPPSVQFKTNTAGTITWDFHTSATPPAAGAGDLQTGTIATSGGVVDATIELTPDEVDDKTGYLHFRQGNSNVLTSQVVTVTAVPAAPEASLHQSLPATNGFGTYVHCSATSVDTLTADISASNLTPYMRVLAHDLVSAGNYELRFRASVLNVRYVYARTLSFDATTSAMFDLTGGVVTLGVGSMFDLGGGVWECRMPFDALTDTVGNIDVGMSDLSNILRVSTPPDTGNETLTVTNAEIWAV